MKTLLHVEDEPSIQSGFAFLCKDLEIQVLMAMSLKEALEHLANIDYKIDAIIWDGKLPDGFSPETIRQVRASGYVGPMAANSGDNNLLKEQMKAGCTVKSGKHMSPLDILRALGLLE